MGIEREIERRGGIPAEIKADGDGIKVAGYAAVFNQETEIGSYFREVFLPGAFDKSIGKNDVPFLIQHHDLPLARTRSGTLKLSADGHGIRMESTLDANDPDVARIVPKMKRGDLDKMSIAFRAVKERWDDTQDPPLRTVEEAILYDVSIVTDPAYPGTEIGLRSLERHRDQAKRQKNYDAARTRLRMKMHLRMMDGETAGDADEAFAKAMIRHHQDAVAMAKKVLEEGDDKEIANLAKKIIDAQTAEIEWLKDWLSRQA
ncbi:HK97 family phage prohead protease [Aminobacter sp. BE322]|uniref:HK97 family phage prohead protease n=1 Tax=unclassified Aminobacter TaxID=2644704 RepID=UPI003D22E3EC